MRAIITFGCDYPETLRPALEALAAEPGEITGLSATDLIDAIESGEQFAILECEVVD